MPDDPRDILRAAGVECTEVDEYRNNPWGMSATGSNGFGYGGYVAFTPKILADAAIAALEVIVAERDDALAELGATLDEPLPDFPHMIVDPPARCEGCYVIVKALEHAK